jgi:hypothetical protein
LFYLYKNDTENKNNSGYFLFEINVVHLLLQVVLKFRQSTLSCGGSLIRACTGELVVLTAAQCVDG